MASVEAAPQADACGALGCRSTEGLVEVEKGVGTRVLCPECAERWT